MEPSELDPAGVLTRSVDPGTGFVPVQGPELLPVRPRPPAQPAAPARFPWWPAAAALAGAVAVIVLDAVAVSLAGNGSYVAASVLAWVAIVLSAVVVIAGVLALVLGRGRVLAIVAVVAAVLANPFLLTRILELAGS